ncbi:hypothetical protein BV898_08323 [Hypsibius exemplaris]|uniref:Peptidase M12A domain-containing protein n=1 Tax=Hypsibius exemplaris TaxID=2072580 RepID=A0A1W0WQU4_HYPEX|nr:hypothetical protein BV898_08323 [Hypsibius exemplaris]
MAATALCFLVLACIIGTALGTYNTDPSFSKWPTYMQKQILFAIDTSYYTAAEQLMIRNASIQISLQMKSCIAFVETARSDTRYKIFITPYTADGVLQTFCYSYQGQWNTAIDNRATEQLMLITRGTYGCLDGTLHSILKYFAIVLGKRNEHQRGDRETVGINVLTGNLQTSPYPLTNAYRFYNGSEANWALFPYDYCSITHNQPSDYANSGTQGFTVISDPKAIPKLDKISNTDCKLLSMIYSCPAANCDPMDCVAERIKALNSVSTVKPMATTMSPASPPPISTVAGSVATLAAGATTKPTVAAGVTTPAAATTIAAGATTVPVTTVPVTTVPVTTVAVTATTTPVVTTTATSTTMTSTTTFQQCPSNAYCTNAPDESSYLLGPFVQYQTLLLFSGQCVLEYKFNWATAMLDPTQPPELITSYFPGPGGPTATPPLSLNYMSYSPANDGTITLTMCALMSSSCLTCVENGAVEFQVNGASTCPNPSNTVTTDPDQTVTSVTSQVFQGVSPPVINQYVVLKASNRTEIGLMSSDFSTLYQSSTGFLSGQSTIVQITAIQIIQDQQGFNGPPMLAVFGIGADGLGYVGYVIMPLGADPNLALGPYNWVLQPVPIGQSISTYCP